MTGKNRNKGTFCLTGGLFRIESIINCYHKLVYEFKDNDTLGECWWLGLQFLLHTDSTDEKKMRVTTPQAPTPFQNYEIPNIEIMIIRSTH
jgi:hypothetical protein